MTTTYKFPLQGIAASIPLPRIDGLPIQPQTVNVSYHANTGPVRMFLHVQQSVLVEEEEERSSVPRRQLYRPTNQDTIEEEPGHKMALASKKVTGRRNRMAVVKRYSSPRIGRRDRKSPVDRKTTTSEKLSSSRSSKTLPRGFSLTQSESIYGLYEDLLNVEDYECGATNMGDLLGSKQNGLHRSDPELNTIPYRMSTLDRRMTFKLQRPRSLDFSSWSVESRASNHTTSRDGNL